MARVSPVASHLRLAAPQRWQDARFPCSPCPVSPRPRTRSSRARRDLNPARILETASRILAEEGLERDGERAHLLAAGAALGYLAGLKTTGALGAVALGGVVAIVELRRAGGGRAMRALAWLALPACALLLPWLVRSAVQTGNPFYPLFWERFGGPEWSSDLATRLAQWQRSIGMGRKPLDYLLLPWRVVTQGDAGYDHFDGRLGPAAPAPKYPCSVPRRGIGWRCRPAPGGPPGGTRRRPWRWPARRR